METSFKRINENCTTFGRFAIVPINILRDERYSLNSLVDFTAKLPSVMETNTMVLVAPQTHADFFFNIPVEMRDGDLREIKM